MVIHAGGYSQRLPNVSVSGKVFMALPCGMYNSDIMLFTCDTLFTYMLTCCLHAHIMHGDNGPFTCL